LKKRNKSSKQCEDNQHTSNLSLIILDEHNNLHNIILDNIDDGSTIPGGMLHAATQLFGLTLNSEPPKPKPPSLI
jgi:hypothetical protein